MRRKLGAHYVGNGNCEFTVWAPELKSVEVKIISTIERTIPLQKDKRGYWQIKADKIDLSDLYFYKLNGEKERPDPASVFQPKGVHGPSGIINHQEFKWNDVLWKGLPISDLIIYELHTGTFSNEGTFDGIISKLPYLVDLGINAIEIMPISQFPGSRNWGYDGVFPFAAHNTYGGPEDLKKLVDACHRSGIAVVLDVVYNHIGPEGNYLNDFGPYFTDKYLTPWGKALNFDDAHCDEVRNFFIQNALMWFRDFHVDVLRLDAVHAIKDFSAKHFLQELSEETQNLAQELQRELILIGECDLNDPKFIDPITKRGYGLTGQWCDEFHHALHSLVTGERDGYYEDFGEMEHLHRAFEDTFVYSGQYSSHRQKSFGLIPKENPYSQFVVFAQNHDQIGNRMLGDRISSQVSFEELKLLASAVVISPHVPLLFMGEEYGEENPFMYFISHTDAQLVEAVRTGRKKEFEYFKWLGEVPDPQAEETFLKCKLNWSFREDNKKAVLFDYYKNLIQLRKTHPAFKNQGRNSIKVHSDSSTKILAIERIKHEQDKRGESLLYCIFNLANEDVKYTIQVEGENWKRILNSADKRWLGMNNNGPGFIKSGEIIEIKKHSVLVYEKEQD